MGEGASVMLEARGLEGGSLNARLQERHVERKIED
jgi:hypothetical protein